MKKEKVIVGLSGGVDSSVAAWLLQEQGYEVEGLFMRNWDSTVNHDFLGNKDLIAEICPQEQDYLDAQKVADHLKIKLHRIDFVKEYWDDVFQYFLHEYQQGRTPNPDILCNKYIKFDHFLNYALHQLGAQKIAMGHYAGLHYETEKNLIELVKAKDSQKDQTYFLSQLTTQQLTKTLFPLANFTKPQIRALAKKLDLPTATKKDSTGICFIGERRFTEFLQNYLPNLPGPIIDWETKTVLGQHLGVMYYTIGQRKGLNLGGQAEPFYVVKKDVAKKILYVARASDQKPLLSQKVLIKDLNWINPLSLYFSNPDDFEAQVKFRYRQTEVPVRVQKQADGRFLLTMSTPVRAITEGQAAVFYHHEICLGGGDIDVVFTNFEIKS